MRAPLTSQTKATILIHLHCMDAIDISPADVNKLFSGLDPHKARLLKVLALEITPALTRFIKASIQQGVIRDNWRMANVTPVFKKGDRSNPENYRSISLTSIPCKVLEYMYVICTSLVSYLDDK